MNSLTHIRRRPLITALAVTLALLGSSLGVAKSASAAAPGHPGAVVERVLHVEPAPMRHHLAHLETESGEVRHPMEVLNLATARPLDSRGSAAGGSSCGGSR
jgi:hypothetical protein